MDRVLVTGGAGFIGSNFVHHLVAHTDASVTVLDKLTYAASEESLRGLPEDRVTLVVGDVADAATVDPLVAGHDAVVHFAAESHNDNSLTDPGPFIQTNLVGTFDPARGGPQGRRAASTTSPPTRSTAISTSTTRKRFTEDTPYNPSSPYSAAKAGSDHLVRAWVRSFGVRATISNCSNNYGPWQHVEKFIPRQITNVIDGGRPKVYGDGLNVRDWIHTEDHSSAVRTILEHGRVGETYLVGADGERSNLDVVRAILRHFGRDEDDIELRHRPRRPRPPLRHRVRQAPRRARLEAGVRRLRGRARGHHRLVPGPRGLVAPARRTRPRRATPPRGSDGRRRPRDRADRDPRTPARAAPGARGRPRLVQGELAAREDGRPRAARLRPGPEQHLLQLPPGRDPGHPRRAVGQVRRASPRAASSPPGWTCARATPSGSRSRPRSTPASRSSSPVAWATPTRPSRTAPPTATWSTPTGARARPTPRSTSRTRRRRSPGRSRSRSPTSPRRTWPTRSSTTSSRWPRCGP